MRAVVVEAVGTVPEVMEVPDPSPDADGVVVRVEATGLCRSDWHGWMGHDPDIALPHVPGHELAGVVEAVGPAVTRWRVGDRVTTPFVLGCGRCGECASGNHQVCSDQRQPGFTGWGSFAQLVALPRADINLVAVPDGMTSATAASLGCRFATAFRAVVDQGRLVAGEWLAVHGAGGVGLSAVMIGSALGARVVAVDIAPAALDLARRVGATATIDAREGDVAAQVRERTDGGAHVSVDALGLPSTCAGSVASLRTRGRHVQVGLLGDTPSPPVPMALVVALELEVRGSHGMAAHDYPRMLAMVADGLLRPQDLVGREIGLDEVPAALAGLDRPTTAGMTMVTDLS